MLETDDCLMAGWEDFLSQGAAGLPTCAATLSTTAAAADDASAAAGTQAQVRLASATILVVHLLMQPSSKQRLQSAFVY